MAITLVLLGLGYLFYKAYVHYWKHRDEVD